MRLVILLLCSTSYVLSEEIKQDEAQDRFVDLSVDVSYGLPQLGYVYNGLHLRGPRSRDYRKARQGFSHYVHHDDHGASFQAHHDHSEIKPELDFDNEFESLRSKIKRNPNAARVPDVKVVVDSDFNSEGTNAEDQNIEVLVEEAYKNPEESFVVPREVESGYEAPEINYAEPEEQTYEIPKEAYEHPQEPTAHSPPVTYSPVQYNDQFSKPPYVAPSNTDVKYHAYPSASGNAASKPPLHIKIQQDLQGLVGSVTNPFKSKPKEVITNINGDRPKRQSGLKLRLPKTPEGKPPLMEKIRQDFFSWLPSSIPSSSSKAQFSVESSPEHVAQAERPKRQNIFPKEPMLTKFVKDINTFNRFIANQAIDLGSGNAPTFSEISSGFRDSVDGLFAPAKKRQDFPAIQYVPKTTQK